MNPPAMSAACAGRRSGFTLVELLVALALGAVLVGGATQLCLATTAGFRLQQSLSQLQETARLVSLHLEDAVRPAGFHPQPWQAAGNSLAIGANSADAANAGGDRLETVRWSDRNCFDNPNPAVATDGLPRYELRITTLQVSAGNLALGCRYGPESSSLVTQLNQLGLAEGVERLQLQYAVDADGDGLADRWVDGGQWGDETRLRAVRWALVVASEQAVAGAATGPLALLDGWYAPPADGRLRLVVRGAAALAGRLP